MKNKFILILIINFFNIFQSSYAADNFVIGVGTHFGYAVKYEMAFKQWAGLASINAARDEILWRDSEVTPNQYAFSNGGAVAQSFFSRNASIKPILIFAYGNSNYDNGGFPVTEVGVNSFVEYTKWIVKNSGAYTDTFELWNEWNLGAGSVPHERFGSPIDYVKLARKVYPAIKKIKPDAKLLVGAVGQEHPEWKWLKQAVEEGVLEYADGISVHLYNHCDLANVGSDKAIKQIDSLKAWLTNRGEKYLPIYVTEFGWPNDVGPCGVSERDSGIHTLRFLLEMSKRNWIKGAWIYEFMDSGSDKENREHNFGLLRRDGSEKFAGCVVRNFSKIISNRPYLSFSNKGVNVSAYRYLGDTFIFYWALNPVENKRYKIIFGGNKSGVVKKVNLCDADKPFDGNDVKSLFITGKEPVVIKVSGDVSLSDLTYEVPDGAAVR